MRQKALLACLALVLLPGCASSDGDAGDDVQPPAQDGADGGLAPPQVIDGSGTIAAGAGTPVISFSNGAGSADFAVSGNVTLLFAELSWSSPAVALDLCVHAPSDGDTQGVPNCGTVEDGGSPGAPTGLVTYTLANPEAGDGWAINPYLDGPAAQQDYQLKVTLFHGPTTVPSGYTALS